MRLQDNDASKDVGLADEYHVPADTVRWSVLIDRITFPFPSHFASNSSKIRLSCVLPTRYY